MFRYGLQAVLTLLIAGISVIGDKLVEHEKDLVLRALSDNVTHGLVAAVSWTLIVVLCKETIIHNISNIVLCSAISSMVDLDHFIAAESWKISDVVRLHKRPFLHCTTLPIVIWVLLLMAAKHIESIKIETCSWIILIGFLSHHIRDATRRGLWLAPFGSTKRIPYFLYLVADMILPYIVFISMNDNRLKSSNIGRGLSGKTMMI